MLNNFAFHVTVLKNILKSQIAHSVNHLTLQKDMQDKSVTLFIKSKD